MLKCTQTHFLILFACVALSRFAVGQAIDTGVEQRLSDRLSPNAIYPEAERRNANGIYFVAERREPNAIYFVAERRKPSGLSTKNTVETPEGSRPTANKTTRLGAKVDGIGREPSGVSAINTLGKPDGSRPAAINTTGLGAIVDSIGLSPTLPQAPKVLRDPTAPADRLPEPSQTLSTEPMVYFEPVDTPYGFSGPSGVSPTETQTNSRFDPVADRWRIGFPDYDRYAKGHPFQDDYPGVEGTWWDPYNQNVLKGDYPLIGIDKFFRLTGRSLTLFEGRQLPTPTTPFEATRNPGSAEFFGDPDQYFFAQYHSLSFELFQGSSSFKPMDWRVKLNFVYNLNHLVADELAIVSPDVRDGQSRFRQDFTLEEWFLETKLMDTSPYDDFMSVRAGSQNFTSDFRGFIFSDLNRAVRLFGTREANRDQYNLIWFDQTEKDTNSLLNRFDKDRHQNTVIANYYRQDFLFPGYTANASFHYNRDKPSTEFDRNNFLVRPDPVGVFAEHDVRSYYFGFAGNGHMERINVSNALYYVFGRDELNPIAGRRQDISAWMGALELSYDRDWARFRTSYLFSSGDADPNNSHATGFDTIFANPNFAGNEFSYWGRQGIRLFGVELTNRQSLTPSMKNGKFQAQPNYVNPGLHLFNLGVDADLTPKLKLIHNTNFLWFNQTEVLETFLFTGEVNNFVGTDISLGAEYRPFLNNNVLMLGGFSTLIAGDGLKDLFQDLNGNTRNHLAAFWETVLEF